MDATSLPQLARQLLEKAHGSHSGRAAQTIHGGREHSMKHTLLALAAGQELAEHENPGEATLFVVDGAVELRSGDDAARLGPGDLITIPDARHALAALEDSAVVLTVVSRNDT